MHFIVGVAIYGAVVVGAMVIVVFGVLRRSRIGVVDGRNLFGELLSLAFFSLEFGARFALGGHAENVGVAP